MRFTELVERHLSEWGDEDLEDRDLEDEFRRMGVDDSGPWLVQGSIKFKGKWVDDAESMKQALAGDRRMSFYDEDMVDLHDKKLRRQLIQGGDLEVRLRSGATFEAEWPD